MPTTPQFGFRYPSLADASDGPTAFRNLATDVEARLFSSIGSERLAAATTTTSVTSSTSFVDVTGLAVSVLANATYALDGFIAYNAGATGDIKFAFTAPAGADALWGLYGIGTGETTSTAEIQIARLDALGDTAAMNGGGVDSGLLHCRPLGTIITGATPGTLQLRMAQVTSNATASVVQTGSWLRLTRLTHVG